MLHRNKFAHALSAWKHPSLSCSMASVIHEDWGTWSNYETYKRLIWIYYIYDILFSIFYDTECHLNIADFTVPTPGETNVWEARTSMEWFWMLAGDTKYRNLQDSLAGISVFNVLSMLRQHTITNLPFNSWQLAASIAVINLEISRALTNRREAKMESFQFYDCSGDIPTKIGFLGEYLNFSEMRLMLQNWFDAWKRCPGIFDRDGNPKQDEICFYELVHLYYTANILLCSFAKPLNEFLREGPGMALNAKVWLQKRIPRGNRNKIVSWDVLLLNTSSPNQNPDEDILVSFDVYDHSPKQGLTSYG